MDPTQLRVCLAMFSLQNCHKLACLEMVALMLMLVLALAPAPGTCTHTHTPVDAASDLAAGACVQLLKVSRG